MYCITCGSDKTIKLWNPHKNLFLKTYSGHSNEVLDACGSCDSRLKKKYFPNSSWLSFYWRFIYTLDSHLLSGGADKTVVLWDVATGKPLRRFRVHVSNVSCVKFNEESSLAFSGSIDNSVMIWDLRAFNFQPLQTLKDAKDSITSLHVSDYEIITGSLDCKIRRYDIRAGSLYMDFVGGTVLTYFLALNVCYNFVIWKVLIATITLKLKYKVVDKIVKNYAIFYYVHIVCLNTRIHILEPVICTSLTQDGQCFIVSTSKNNIMLFDKSTGELLNE